MAPMNRFRDPTLRKQYDVMVRLFREGHRDVGTPVKRCKGNSFAGYFWQGFDGVAPQRFADRDSRQTLAYACFRAGQDCKGQ